MHFYHAKQKTAMNKIVIRMLTVCSVLAEQKEVHTSFRLASKKEDKQFVEIK